MEHWIVSESSLYPCGRTELTVQHICVMKQTFWLCCDYLCVCFVFAISGHFELVIIGCFLMGLGGSFMSPFDFEVKSTFGIYSQTK